MAGFGSAIVVGAAGGMGRMFLDQLVSAGCETTGWDVRPDGSVKAADILDLSEEMRLLLRAADLVLLAVPDGVACQAGAGIAGAMAPDAMLVDCTSVKAPYVRAVQHAGSCGLVSVNPLFGPGLSWAGRSIVVTELRAPRFPERLTGFLENAGLRILRLDAERHDRLAAEGQAQLHAAILGFLVSASAEGMAFDTPPNRVMRMLAARILSGEPEVYWKIQMSNPFAAEARRRLITALQTLDEICAAGDEEGFARLLWEARGHLGQDGVELSADCVRLFGALESGLR
ncbi:prephenate dehydrogenase/arogenate dehydrogenase family protein [Paracoccus benzoatiresistens]|uniref:Prephenate dehydrogenase/arogenate dehydrogenase family protein n=1 Tax=Paracoccus benzoatiresistens TaxID=2997341 RepID=A0ABT4JCD8_9RHOB|nr:prephenate dehydrogenase/arogenate dehydrogenase family protein [Paracoccus sp. EF6]MCZ0963998.1 prephenate dehydrogenase/arogenate dehydrogenase family protein [Paracoccus sp. EF6]